MRLLLAGALGAALAYFFDRDNGTRRRKMAVDRAGGFFRQRVRDAARAGRGVAAEAYGAKQKVAHRKEAEKEQPDDVTLARKVESEIFRDADVPKGKINVNVEDGVVYLRGELEQRDLIKDLENQARQVQGVLGVENLLHVPGEEAPAKPE
jgi:osmotically-inducible protein OsmY